jgi:uncharacterized protein (TIGR02118 family)
MIKMMVLIKRKEGISSEAFRDHYENVHVPLIRKLHPMIKTYRRNYIDADLSALPPEKRPDFDVITEVSFDSWADFESFKATSASPIVRPQVLADEAHFCDTPRTRRLVVIVGEDQPSVI